MTDKLDRRAFEKLRRIVPNQLSARRASPQDWRPRPLPEELAFKLTNRCDLRCAHCYQWGPAGYHHRLPRADVQHDLELPVISKVLAATHELQSNVYLWGGEPLLYHDWDNLMLLLAADQRWTSICTNGALLPHRLPSLLPISQRLELVVALDGFAPEHEALRGPGAFARTMHGLDLLLQHKRTGSYRGEVTVNCVISDMLVGHLFEFVSFLESLAIDTLYLSLPWYISAASSELMDRYFASHFAWLPRSAQPSWHSYGFSLAPSTAEALPAQLDRVSAANFRLKLRCNPPIRPAELPAFISGSVLPAQDKVRCLALLTRMDVCPNGDVVSCKFFPEFVMGNLQHAQVTEVWLGNRYSRVRETLGGSGLMPVCAKCNLLYTRGA